MDSQTGPTQQPRISEALEVRRRIMLRNNVHITGRPGARTLLFAHGFGTDQKIWRLVAPAFTDEYQVVRFDYVGSGGAERPADSQGRYASLEGYVSDVIEICDALALRDIVFVAHSVSGMIGILTSLRAPSLMERMILVTPSARYLNDPPQYLGGFGWDEVEDLLQMMEQNFLGWADTIASIAAKDPELSKELFDAFSSADPRTARQFAEVTFRADVRAELPRVRVPSLLLVGDDDDIVPLPASEYLRDHLPNSRYRVLPVPGHCPQISAPNLVIDAMREFLAVGPEALQRERRLV